MQVLNRDIYFVSHNISFASWTLVNIDDYTPIGFKSIFTYNTYAGGVDRPARCIAMYFKPKLIHYTLCRLCLAFFGCTGWYPQPADHGLSP